MSFQKIHCPVCQENTFDQYRRKNNIMLFQCAGCSFIFADIAHTNLVEFYNNEYLKSVNGFGSYVDYEFDKMPMGPTYRDVLRTLASIRPGKRLLDAGAANGYFVSIANACGYKAEGFDINVSATKDALSRGRKVKQGDLFTCEYAKNSFDIITAFDFFEHISQNDLERYAQAMNELLSSNGVLTIITVNTASMWARIIGKYWHSLLPPEHISFFSKKNIKFFLEHNGFDVLEVRTIHKTFSLQYIINILYKWQKLSLWLHITSFLERHPYIGRRAFKLYIGDNMLIIARKRDAA